MRHRLMAVGGTLLLSAGAVLGMLQCSTDEDLSVDIATSCDVAKLRTDDPVEVTVRLFVQTANDLGTEASALEKRFTDICNAVNQESGEEPGSDIHAACNKIAARLDKAQKTAPVPDGGTAPIWVHVGYPETCSDNAQEEAACLSQCAKSPPCDIAQSCPAGKQSGSCAGSCTGVCRQAADNTACVGECAGACGTPDGGVVCAAAECVGTCTAATWAGQCESGCDAKFVGLCGGTCNGTCDGAKVGAQPDGGAPPDGGGGGGDAGGDGGDGGDGGPVEAGPPPDAGPPPPPPPAPGGADGNCTGVCVGSCSSKASGSCGAKCRGAFSGGECTGGPARCIGTCTGASIACLATCKGTCSVAVDGGSCGASCAGSCSGQLTNEQCGADLTCDANVQCHNVCKVRGALKANCQPPAGVEVRVAGDLAIYQALKAHAGDFAAAALEANLLNTESFRISSVTLEDYKTLGATRDKVRVCVTAGSKSVDDARTSLATSVAAAQVIKGLKF